MSTVKQAVESESWGCHWAPACPVLFLPCIFPNGVGKREGFNDQIGGSVLKRKRIDGPTAAAAAPKHCKAQARCREVRKPQSSSDFGECCLVQGWSHYAMRGWVLRRRFPSLSSPESQSQSSRDGDDRWRVTGPHPPHNAQGRPISFGVVFAHIRVRARERRGQGGNDADSYQQAWNEPGRLLVSWSTSAKAKSSEISRPQDG